MRYFIEVTSQHGMQAFECKSVEDMHKQAAKRRGQSVQLLSYAQGTEGEMYLASKNTYGSQPQAPSQVGSLAMKQRPSSNFGRNYNIRRRQP